MTDNNNPSQAGESFRPDRVSFGEFIRREEAGLSLVSDDMKQDEAEREEWREFEKRRLLRKRTLLFENLGLVLRHRQEILATPRYADIGVDYALEGGGAFCGPMYSRWSCTIAGAGIGVRIRLGTLLEIWDAEAFKVKCGCGETAVVRRYVGSPLSGQSCATAFCPGCGKEVRDIRDRSFGQYHWHINHMLRREVEQAARRFTERWSSAEEACRNNVENYSRPSPTHYFKGDDEPCSIETMINELRLKEFHCGV